MSQSSSDNKGVGVAEGLIRELFKESRGYWFHKEELSGMSPMEVQKYTISAVMNQCTDIKRERLVCSDTVHGVLVIVLDEYQSAQVFPILK